MSLHGIVFLMYHELEVPGRPLCQPEPGYVRYILPEDSFRAQMSSLAQNGWRGLSCGEALAYPAGSSVAITFDDGCETDLLVAAPILKESSFNATFYITAGFVGKPGYMDPAQLRQLHSFGFEIGCHSMTHPYLDDLGETALRREIVEAGKKLEDMIGSKVNHFSCPGGRWNRRVLELARAAGYKSLATSQARVNSSATNPFFLGRVPVRRNLTETGFRRVCAGKTLWPMRLGDSLRSASKQLMGNTLYDRLRERLLH